METHLEIKTYAELEYIKELKGMNLNQGMNLPGLLFGFHSSQPPGASAEPSGLKERNLKTICVWSGVSKLWSAGQIGATATSVCLCIAC